MSHKMMTTLNEQDSKHPLESSDICDHDPLNNPDLNHNGYPKKGVFEKSAVFSPCDHSGLGSRKAGCKLNYNLIKEENLKYICGTHNNHWHERLNSCERKLRFSKTSYF